MATTKEVTIIDIRRDALWAAQSIIKVGGTDEVLKSAIAIEKYLTQGTPLERTHETS